MNVPLFKALIALLPVSLLLSGSVIMWVRGKTSYQFIQLVGAGCLVVVVLTHVCESLHLFPGMHWGLDYSAGHYIDLAAAVLGVALFPVGYLLQAIYQPASGTVGGKSPLHSLTPGRICAHLKSPYCKR